MEHRTHESSQIVGDKTKTLNQARSLISSMKYIDKTEFVEQLLAVTPYDTSTAITIQENAAWFIEWAQSDLSTKPLLDTFLAEYGLSNQEGVTLMCVAESLLRIPDQRTAGRLIADKIQLGDWATHASQADSLLVNASSWALMLTGRLVAVDHEFTSSPKKVVRKVGQPFRRYLWR